MGILPSDSISKKIGMAMTGFLLIGFLVTHLAANLLLFVSPEAYNNYSHALISNPLIYIAEAALVFLFLYHAVLAIKVTLGNRSARPQSYHVSSSLGKKTIFSSTMMWTGSVILVFLVLHLISFKFGEDVAPHSPDGVRDLYSLVVARFQSPLFSLFYIICMCLLGCHLTHAIQSSARSLGLSHPKYLTYAKAISYILGIAFTVGYSSFPIYFGFIKKM